MNTYRTNRSEKSVISISASGLSPKLCLDSMNKMERNGTWFNFVPSYFHNFNNTNRFNIEPRSGTLELCGRNGLCTRLEAKQPPGRRILAKEALPE